MYRADLVTSLNADAATAALLAYGKQRARALMGPSYDNITCAVVYITVADAPAAAAAVAATEAPTLTWSEDIVAAAAGGGAATDQQVLDCPLHGPPAREPGRLWYSKNVHGQYAMFAPPCNGCEEGKRDA